MFVSQKRIEANRRNAQKSTGPRTEEGKARVSQNGLKHGLYATKPILTVAGWAEQPADYDSLYSALTAELRPASPVEHLLVRRLTAYAWHLIRAEKIAVSLEAKPLDGSVGQEPRAPAILECNTSVTQGGSAGLPPYKNSGGRQASCLPQEAGTQEACRAQNMRLLVVLIRRLRARMERTFDTLQIVRENRHPALVAQISAALQKTNDAGNKATLSNPAQISIAGGEAPGASHWLDAKPLLEKVV